MPDQRKYIIWAFLIFAFVFAGAYFIAGFVSKNGAAYRTVDAFTSSDNDTSKMANDGKILFQNKCAACHAIQIDFTGPDLTGVTGRGPWTNRKNIYDFLKNSMKFRTADKYMQELRKKYPITHQAFLMDDKAVDAILRYVDLWNK